MGEKEVGESGDRGPISRLEAGYHYKSSWLRGGVKKL